jgi:hypothetical protein
VVTGRGWVIATVAALLGGIGAFCGAITNVLVGIGLAAAATARTSPDAAARFLVTAFNLRRPGGMLAWWTMTMT